MELARGGECDAVRVERIVASSGRLPKRRELAGRRRADADPRREGSASDEDGEIAGGGGGDGRWWWWQRDQREDRNDGENARSLTKAAVARARLAPLLSPDT